MVFTCVRNCQWRGRVWTRGETVVFEPGEDFPPSHFRANGRLLECQDGVPERHTDFLVIVGDSPNTPRHIAAFKRTAPYTVAAVNRGASRWTGHIDFVVSLHVHFFLGIDAPGATLVSDKCSQAVGNRIINASSAGGSGGMAIQLGLQMGFPKILLLGVELTATNYVPMRPFFESLRGKECIRSMGGWTADLFGLADAAWMEE